MHRRKHNGIQQHVNPVYLLRWQPHNNIGIKPGQARWLLVTGISAEMKLRAIHSRLTRDVRLTDLLTSHFSQQRLESERLHGVTIDSKLSLSAHVAALCRTGFYHLRQLRPMLRSLTHEAARTLIQAFISSRLDYCNSLLYGCLLYTSPSPRD